MIDLFQAASLIAGLALGVPAGALGALTVTAARQRRASMAAPAVASAGRCSDVAAMPAPAHTMEPAAPAAIPPPRHYVVAAAKPRTAAEHAAALADWVLAPAPLGVRGKTLAATELIEAYSEMCGEAGVEPRGWQPVAVEFQRLLGIAKRYATASDGRRYRVYQIPEVDAAAMRAGRPGALVSIGQRPPVVAPAELRRAA